MKLCQDERREMGVFFPLGKERRAQRIQELFVLNCIVNKIQLMPSFLVISLVTWDQFSFELLVMANVGIFVSLRHLVNKVKVK